MFIGSSSKAKSVAKALRANFKSSAKLDVRVWDISNWKKSYSSLSALFEFLETYHYGVFLLTPDDAVKQPAESKKKLTKAPRDNVIFELGLWFGRVGRDRTFYVRPHNIDLSIPSDLDGIDAITFHWPEDIETCDTSDLRAALADAADEIVEAVEAYEQRARSKNYFYIRIAELQERLGTAQSDMESITMLRDGLGRILQERAAVMAGTIQDALQDLLIWTRSLLDGLDTDQLAQVQAEDLDEVLVFAPEPLEAEHGVVYEKLRRTVLDNILKRSVDYVYFVADRRGVDRIKSLIGKLSRQASGDAESNKRKLLKNIKIVIVPFEEFRAYYTVQRCGNSYVVYQSIVRDNRDDFIVKIEGRRSRFIVESIERLLQKSQPVQDQEAKVLLVEAPVADFEV